MSKSELKRIAVQSGVEVGRSYHYPMVGGYGTVRVMAIADGYCMVRRPGCAPFVVSLREMACTSEAVASREGTR